jgi:hypothetical protein
MTAKTYTLALAILLTVFAFLHFARATLRLPIVINGVSIPVWASWAVCGLLLLIALLGYYVSDR